MALARVPVAFLPKRVGTMTFSRAVRVGSSPENWKTNPISRERSSEISSSERPPISIPRIRTVPEVGRMSPASMPRRVDFPLPERPTIRTNSPGRTPNCTSSTARTSAVPLR